MQETVGPGQTECSAAIFSATAGAKVQRIFNEAGQFLGKYYANGMPLHETEYLDAMHVGVHKKNCASANSNISASAYTVDTGRLRASRFIIRKSGNLIVWCFHRAKVYCGIASRDPLNGFGELVFKQCFYRKGLSKKFDCRMRSPQNVEFGMSSWVDA